MYVGAAGECAAGDFLILASDALACWFLNRNADGEKPWETLFTLDQAGWSDWGGGAATHRVDAERRYDVGHHRGRIEPGRGDAKAMPWPGITDFSEAVQNPGLCFKGTELEAGTVSLNQRGMPQGLLRGLRKRLSRVRSKQYVRGTMLHP